MVQRNEYLKKLITWKDEQVIKVVTGIRRCGKSTLLLQYQEYLKKNNIKEEQILAINFEELEYEELLDYKKLYQYIKNRMCADKTTYIFLDEVQKVEGFEKVVDSLYVKAKTDLYIMGSNAWLLSSDLSTFLTGRYVEISMLPLSFSEYLELVQKDKDSAFADYMKYGSMPLVATMNKIDEKVDAYLEGIYNTVIVRDIEDRQRRQESDPQKRKITDIALLKTIARYLASVIGSTVSIRSITDYLTSNGRKISPNTVNDYVEALTEAFIFYPVERFDLSGKQLLKVNKKYYMADLGIRNHILPKKSYDLGFSIENIAYLELIRRGFKVTVGKYQNAEVDFVAQKQDFLIYFQVTANMTDQDTFDREMRPFYRIQDHYEKIVLTLDKFSPGNYDGIKIINLLDWLTSG